jgi:hypothetical protein
VRIVEVFTQQVVVMKATSPWYHPVAVPVLGDHPLCANADKILDLTPPKESHLGMAVYQSTFYFYILPTAQGPTASDEDRWIALTGDPICSNGISPLFGAAH